MAAKDYVRVTMRGHPVADSSGKVYVHRQTLYDTIGPGPHRCHWCKWDGLQWDVSRDDPNYLIPDHLNGDGRDNRPENLVPAHSWCNNNRATIEGQNLPRPLSWALFEHEAPGARKPLYNPQTKMPTKLAYELASAPAPVASDPGPPPPARTETRGRAKTPLREGFLSWTEALNPTPPAWLQDAYPWLLEELGL